MIDVTKLQSSSLFAGFANTGVQPATITIPGNQTIPGFAGGAFAFTADVKRPNAQSLIQVLFNVVGPSTTFGEAHDPTKWKSTFGDFVMWYQPDGGNFQIDCDVLKVSPDIVRLRVSYATLQVDPQTYVPAVTVNAKVYFYQYPWE